MATEVRIYIPGPDRGMNASSVVATLQSLLKLAQELEAASAPPSTEGVASSTWAFTRLALGSLDAAISPLELRPGATPEDADRTQLRLVQGFLSAASEDVLPEGWSERAGRIGRGIAGSTRRDFRDGIRLRLVRDGEPLPEVEATITEETGRHLGRALTPNQETIGSVAGTLGSISVHGRRTAGLWPDRGGARLTIGFTDDDFPLVHQALGRRVLIGGRIKRNSAGQPIRLAMRTLELLPESTPPIAGLYGLAPGITGGLTVTEYLETIRGAS